MKSELLNQAVEVIIRADKAHALDELSDAVQWALQEFRGDVDRKWRLQNPIGSVNRTATTLARLTGVDFDDARQAVCAATGDCETVAAVNAILKFGKQLAAARRATA